MYTRTAGPGGEEFPDLAHDEGNCMKENKHARRLCEEKRHSLEEEAVFKELQSRPDGLDDGETAERLRFYGPNSLPFKAPSTAWAVLLNQALNPLIFILPAAAVAPLAIGEGADAVFILVVISLNSGLGAYPEYQAEKSVPSLRRLLKIKASMRRIGQERQIPSENVHVFNCRSEKVSAFRIPIRRNLIVVFGVLAAQGIHVLSMHAPLYAERSWRHPVRFSQWLFALARVLVVLMVMEVFKRIARGTESSGLTEVFA